MRRFVSSVPRVPDRSVEIVSASASHVGSTRTSNEDVLVEDMELGLYAVFDGMGGANAGEVAARLASMAVRDHVSRHRASATEASGRQLLEAAIGHASDAVLAEAGRREDCHGMGTTAVACLIPDPRVAHVAYVAHVGDSRAYLSRAGDLRALTRDHSAVQGLIDRGFLTEGGAKDHPMRNMLFKSLGRPNIRAETHAQVLHDGDRLLLCSDGLHGYATHEAIRQVMSQLIPVAHVVVGLIDLALRGGGGDNVSVVVIERGPSGSRRASP